MKSLLPAWFPHLLALSIGSQYYKFELFRNILCNYKKIPLFFPLLLHRWLPTLYTALLFFLT